MSSRYISVEELDSLVELANRNCVILNTVNSPVLSDTGVTQIHVSLVGTNTIRVWDEFDRANGRNPVESFLQRSKV